MTAQYHDRRSPVSPVTILVVIVMLLVPALAWMQYQWLGQLSAAERERMQRTLRTAAAQFATEFDNEISRTLVNLQVDGETIRDQNWSRYAQQYSRWANSTNEPRLVRDVWLVDTLPGTRLPDPMSLERPSPISPDRLRLRKWNAQTLAFEDAAWPPDLLKMRESLATRFVGLQMQSLGTRSPAKATDLSAMTNHADVSLSLAVSDDSTLIAPVTLFELTDRIGPPKISVLGFTIVRLDPAIMRDTILASLASRHFHGEDTEADYRVAVVQREDPTKVVWESEPGAATLIASAPDVTQNFMGPRPDQMFVFARNFRAGGATKLETVAAPPPSGNREPGAGSREPGAGNREPGAGNWEPGAGNREVTARENIRLITRGTVGGFEGRWTLMAKHRAGSLEAAVAAVRMRNLGISSGILLLLTLTVGLIVVSTRRAQNLARQQMEFVAAVSHELRTPVSVIGTAAGNLADGVVGDPQRVRKYGETIQSEARRLGETVERVLQLAGIAAGRAAATRTPVRPDDLIRESLDACRSEIDQAGVTVETSIAEHLPNVAGDVSALKSALQNLISNAIKYGGNAKWMRVSAKVDPGAGTRQQVIFSVEDRGLGIDAEDRKHIFEPFYRGRVAVSQQIQGSGLGLNLVHRIAEAHGGKVTVVSEPGQGSTFTLAIPVAHDRSTSEAESLRLARETSPSR